MPRNVHPLKVTLPSAVQMARELTSSDLRMVLVDWLVDHPRCLVSEIVDAVGGQRATIAENLRALERIGVVLTDEEDPDAPRERRWIRYRVDEQALKRHTQSLVDYLTRHSSTH